MVLGALRASTLMGTIQHLTKSNEWKSRWQKIYFCINSRTSQPKSNVHIAISFNQKKVPKHPGNYYKIFFVILEQKSLKLPLILN